jgi:hypothetical protein
VGRSREIPAERRAWSKGLVDALPNSQASALFVYPSEGHCYKKHEGDKSIHAFIPFAEDLVIYRLRAVQFCD